MLVRFRIDENGFTCVDAPVLANATEIDYIKCHFEFKSEAWKNVQAVLAIFKSATYNKTSEILLDSNGDCYIDPEVYKKGGTIQCKVFGDKYHSDSVNSSSSITEVVEFYINENLTLPTPVPSKYDAFLAEYLRAREVLENVITEVETKLENGEFDGDPGVGISSVTYNSDGTLTITLSDGSSFVSGYSMKGEQGADGVGISNITFGQDGTVTVALSNGTIFTSEYSFKGEKGDQGDQGESGEDGRGIVSITKTATSGLVDTYTITYTDGTTSTFNVTNGQNGAGAVSDVWVNGVSVLDGGIAKVVALQNLVDGSAIGSVRGIGTKEEDSDYTIGICAFAEGVTTRARGIASHAEGSSSTAAGFASHAEGYESYTGKAYAHAEGNSSAEGEYSHSEGHRTRTFGESSHSEGDTVIAFGSSSHAEGQMGLRNTLQEITKVRDYYYSYTIASPYLIAGNKLYNWLTSRYVTIENVDTSNREIYISNADFNEALDIGQTEGFSLTYSGAFGSCSHSEGYDTLAVGENSHAQNLATIAMQPNQTALGKYNIADENGDYVEIVGNGTDASARSNARTLDWSGNESLAGSITLGMGTADETTITATQLKALLALLNT